MRVPTDIVLLVVLWRVRHTLSLRDLAERFLARGFVFTHETVRDWEARIAGDGAEARGLQRVLELLTEWLEPVYGFRALLAFKQKFKPRWAPVYLVHPGVLSLARISLAIRLPRTTSVCANGRCGTRC